VTAAHTVAMIARAWRTPLGALRSSSLGFGGRNASIVLGRPA
jgi:hypothetical protein